MNLGYTGKPYDVVTGLYDYGYRDYSPALARFTTVDPIRDGANWCVYVNNDPVNWIDPWGLEDIVVIRAIDNNSNLNNEYYNYLVEKDFDEIKDAALEKGLTFRLVTGQDATVAQILDEFNNNDTKRLILVYHGTDLGKISDVNGIEFVLSDIKQIGSNLITVDLVGCYADVEINNSERTPLALSSDIRSYNTPGEVIWYSQTNDALRNRIPESIRTGVNTSGQPGFDVPMFEEAFPVYGGYSDVRTQGAQNEKKNR
jgi:RHS repeat-associated protein